MNLPMRRTRLCAYFCAAALLATAACSGGKPVNVAGGSTGGSGRSSGGTLVAAVNAQPDQLDPNKAVFYSSVQVLGHVFDTLVQADANVNMAPSLATSWTTSPDQLTWTFTLRSAKWHDGTPFTNADVVYTYHRLMENKLPYSVRLATVKSVEAEGQNKVVLRLKRPTPNLLVLLGNGGMAIVQKKNVESGAVKNHPVGTGPFRFVSWAHGSAINLTANPDYWGGRPKLAGVKFTFVKDPTVALQNLRSGEVQWTDNLPPQQVESLQKSTGEAFTVQSPRAYGDFWYLVLNVARKPFDDKRVRQAIAYAIDRAALVKATKFSTGEPSQTAVPKGNPWHSDYAPYRYDVAKAKSLLAAAGVHDLTIDFLATSDYPETVTAGQVLASQFAPLGITVKIRSLEGAAYQTDMAGGKWGAMYGGFAGNIDPSDFYDNLVRTDGTFNFQKYSNPAVDKLLAQASVTTDQAQRKALYDQAVKLVVDDAAVIYLSDWKVVQGFSKKLHGYTVRPDRKIQFLHASLG